MVLAFHKPFGVLSQFTPDASENRSLAAFDFPQDVYPIGRLDADSEGLLILSDEKGLVEKLLHPRRCHPRRYWAQVEGLPESGAFQALARGLEIRGRRTLPCRAWMLEPQPEIAPREPPIRVRRHIPDCWIALELVEGKNRQVRRMTAAVGHPVLRLIRVGIGGYELGDMPAGQWRQLSQRECALLLARQG